MRISATRVTPYVNIDLSKGRIYLKGRSSPHSSVTFYQPIIDHLKLGAPVSQNISADVQLEYFNTSSCKCLLNIFWTLTEFEEQGHAVEVNWHVEEDDWDLIEAAEDFEEVTGLHFNIIERKL